MDSDDVVWTVWLDGGIYGNRPMVDNGSYGFIRINLSIITEK